MSNHATVEVLLATFNGERFLREQIDSILTQTYAPLRILARDDGSTDTTVAILEDCAARFPTRFKLLPQPAPTGSAKWNFIRLIEASTAEYLAFSDQDDVWQPKKIEQQMAAMRALETTHGAARPLLVFSDLRIVDQHLGYLHESFWMHQPIKPRNVTRLNRLLAQNVVTGCTALINRPLAALASSMTGDAHMHDWWIAVLTCVFGSAAPLREKLVFYRQHDRNVFGVGHGPPGRGIPKWRFHDHRRAEWETSVHMAQALLNVYGADLTASQRSTAQAFLRCDAHPNRLVRVATWLRHGLFLESGLRPNLALLWYLWDMKAVKGDRLAG